MYAQPNDPSRHQIGDMQSFERDGYSIPANYRGNAFTLDEPPFVEETDTRENECIDCCASKIEAAPPKCLSEAQDKNDCVKESERRGGLLSGIFGRFSRGIELDDIILIGLIVLLLQSDCDRRDETIILLALLLLGGF